MTNQHEIDAIAHPIADILAGDKGFMASGRVKECKHGTKAEYYCHFCKLESQGLPVPKRNVKGLNSTTYPNTECATHLIKPEPSPLPELIQICESLALGHSAAVACAKTDAWRKFCEDEALFWAGAATAIREQIGDEP